MSWKNVIIFALIAGAYTGLINSLPFLDFLQGTSFTDIAVTYEWWILFAVIIVANCKKPLEAGLKVFVFFLISQPLVYLVEVPFKGWGVFAFYNYWFYMTLLTFPGAIIAYYGTHRDDIIGAIIMCVATCMLSAYVSLIVTARSIGQIHLLTLAFCLFQIIVYIFYFIRKRAIRIFAIVLNIIFMLVFGFLRLNSESQGFLALPEIERWDTYELVDGTNYRVEMNDDNLSIYFKPHAQATDVILTTAEGETLAYHMFFDENGILRFEMLENNLTLSLENLEFIKDNIEYLSWGDFDLYEKSEFDESDNLAVYQVGDKYELVLSGRDGDIIENAYLRTIEDGEVVKTTTLLQG